MLNRRFLGINNQSGISLTELLLAVAASALIMTGVAGVIGHALQTEGEVRSVNDLNRQAQFAMQRMVSAVSGTRRLMLPFGDNPATDWRENVREESVPASAPEGSSSKATAVLAVTLSPLIDRDNDGWADANNDKDFLDSNNNGIRDAGEAERIDEDLSGDNTNDQAHGIIGIDDNGDGGFDGAGRYSTSDSATVWRDNDESSRVQPPNEADEQDDPLNGLDDDGDGAIDEDIPSDMNADSLPGVATVDDDKDGLTDEGQRVDDDEDGKNNEDWLDPVVFYLQGSTLIERLPAQTDVNGDGQVTGADFTESIIATQVSRFRVERLPLAGGRVELVDITLELNDADGHKVSLNVRVRVGGGL